MKRTLRNSTGFTLQELLIVLVSFGIIVGFSVPAFVHYRESHELKGATDTVVSQIRLARTVAMSTGVDQPMVFTTDSKGAIYQIRNSDGSVKSTGRLPNSIMYDASTSHSLTLTPSGRANHSGVVVLCDQNGNCDTVSVQRSGFVIAH